MENRPEDDITVVEEDVSEGFEVYVEDSYVNFVERGCCRLEQNMPANTCFWLFDRTGCRIGRALAGNTYVGDLNLLPLSSLTIHGVVPFLLGLHQCNYIEQMSIITTREALPSAEVMHLLYREAMSSVQKIYLRPVLNDEHVSLIAASLTGNTHLKTLNISIGTSITTNAAHGLVRGIRASNIQRFQCHSEEEGSYSNSAVMEILFAGVIMDTTIAHLDFQLGTFNNEEARRLAPHLVGNKTLKSFSFKIATDFQVQDATILADAIRQSQIEALKVSLGDDRYPVTRSNPISGDALCALLGQRVDTKISSQLTSLELISRWEEQNSCTAALPPALAKVLPYLTSLERLTLRNIAVGDEGAAAIVNNWHKNSPLQELGLVSCLIGAVGAQHIIRAVGDHPALIKLNLFDNKQIGCGSLETIGLQLPNWKLKELSLTKIENDDSNSARKAIAALVSGVLSNFHLCYLNTHHLNLPDKDRDEINFYLDLNSHGRKLLRSHFCGNMSEWGWSRILAMNSYNPSAVYYFLRELPMVVSSVGDSFKQAKKITITPSKRSRTRKYKQRRGRAKQR